MKVFGAVHGTAKSYNGVIGWDGRDGGKGTQNHPGGMIVQQKAFAEKSKT